MERNKGGQGAALTRAKGKGAPARSRGYWDLRWHFGRRELWDPGLLLSVSSALTILFGAANGKFLAVTLGPEGMGVFGQASSILPLVTLLAVTGPSYFLVRHIAVSVSTGSEESRRVRGEVVTLLLLSGAVFAVAVALLAPQLAAVLLGDAGLWWVVLATAVALPPASLGLLARSIVQGEQRIGAFALMDVLQAVGGPAAALLLYLWLGTDSVLGAPALAAAATASFAVLVWRSNHLRVARPSVATLRAVWAFSASTAVANLTHQAALITVRSQLIHTLGGREAGLYHAALSISMQVLAVIYMSQTAYMYPRMAAAAQAPDRIREEIDTFLQKALAQMSAATICLVLCGPVLVHVLLSPSFTEAAPVLQWQATADLIRVVPWTLTLVFLPAGDTFSHAAVSVLSAVSLAGGTALALPVLGVYAPIAAAVSSYVAITFIAYAVLWRRYRYVVSRMVVQLLGASAVAITTAFLAAERIDSFPGRLLAAAVLVAIFARAAGPRVPGWLTGRLRFGG